MNYVVGVKMNDFISTEKQLSQIGDDWILKHLKVGEYAEEEKNNDLYIMGNSIDYAI